MNERKTEAIVRNHFNRYLNEISIEEQKSDIPKINKLLKTASKKGHGAGYPEFIITFKDNNNLIIVIECKADIKKHESKTGDNYANYAVDGALLYSSYLSKDYDVLSIAVSGENKKELKVSHFLQLKGNKKVEKVFANKLLKPSDYLEGYLKSDQKVRQDYESLLNFSRELNKQLHSLKIAESKRSLLISCILIALENKAFRKAYKEYDNPKELASFLVNTTINELKRANIKGDKLEDLEVQYNFIKVETSLSTKDGVLRELIESIDENINSFIKNHRYYDILGQFYVEFLRYANSDKGLGIVLTPLHITELFTELAQVNKDSIVYDNCCGTGGFLISAMRKMVEDAKGDLNKIKKIKTKQIIGVEYQPHIFPLAVSNMYIHQDGKSNILKGDCFDESIKKKVKKFKPNIGFLNPPYKSDKKSDIDELEFVLNNLEELEQGGKCIAIVPMQSVLAQKGKTYELKRKLLENHTLEAVLSMPNELFTNSKANVVTAIMIFTAHKPHPKNKETYFGYYKDDGFVKRKGKGRIDAYGKWNKIKEKWVNYYINKKEQAGFSVNKRVTADDEWCAEAYMKTDYSKLNKFIFENTILSYVSFLFSNRMIDNASKDKLLEEELQLDLKAWKEFDITNLFEIKGSKTTSIIELEEYGKGNFPYVTTQATNNGVAGFYNYFTEEGNVLTVDSAVIGYTSYQPFSFSASDHVEKLVPKFEMNKYVAMFLVTILNLEQYRYNYGRKSSHTRLEKIKIKLPSKNKQPDFEFMEKYIKSLNYSSSI